MDSSPLIYLDWAANTPVDPQVMQKMVPYLFAIFGNPASGSHGFGSAAHIGDMAVLILAPNLGRPYVEHQGAP